MTSILTNSGAMVALQPPQDGQQRPRCRSGADLHRQEGGTAKDNAAVWAISKTREADVTGFNKISEGLVVGKSTVAVARGTSETVTDLLTQMKDKITSAQGEDVDASSKEKIQADITALKEQIASVVGASQFNGRNLVDGTTDSLMKVLSSLDRDIDGSVKAANIGVKTADLTTTQQVVDTTAGSFAAAGGGAEQTLNATKSITFTVGEPTGGAAYSLNIDTTDTDAVFTSGPSAGGALTDAGDITYVAREGDTAADVAKGLPAAPSAWAEANDVDTKDVALAIAIDTVTSTSNVAGGALAALKKIDVSTDAAGAVAAIEGLIQNSVDAAASFGTANQIETQSDFVGKLTDNLKAGIGSMVDADMEEASARLKALQQPGIPSLSIANQAPGAVMALFR